MASFKILSVPAQVAAHLRREIKEGRLEGMMPGVLRLETELGVNRNTVETALRILEREGLLIPQGAGKRRGIVRDEGGRANRSLRLAILAYDQGDRMESHMLDLQHSLQEAGHAVFYPPATLTHLGMKVERVARVVEQTPADAWVVLAGSQDVLEWFVSRGILVMAMFGRRHNLPIAGVGPYKLPAIRKLTRTLIDLGHRRIVLLVGEENRRPHPAPAMQAFLDELAAGGIPPGHYHLPEWKQSTEGFQACLRELFRVTPPTALIVDGVALWIATLQFLASKRLGVPQDVSLACTDSSPDFIWSYPAITHIHWDKRPMVRRIVRWANHLAQGKPDLRHLFTPAEFVLGGTIGPVNGSVAAHP
jgi:DNA-binding LacI/PurR family transcriptional regulator